MKSLIARLSLLILLIVALQPKLTAAKPDFAKRQESPWVRVEHNVHIYKINVFNLDPDNVDQEKLRCILKAVVQDSWENFAKSYGSALDIKVYTADRANDPALFYGDRIPFYLVPGADSEIVGFHFVQASEPANSESFIFAGANIQTSLGFSPPANFPDWTPYGAVGSGYIKFLLDSGFYAGNPYAYSLPSDFYQFLSAVMSHEFHEIMGDDSIQNWTLFDSFAPTVQNWRYAEYDSNGVCTNGTLGPDGYVHLPFFNDEFPLGGLFTVLQEDGDPVSRGSSAKLQSYKVDGWAMQNYPLNTFWKAYYASPELSYDKKDFTELPLQPFAGLHEALDVYYLDAYTGFTFLGEVDNFGPVTAAERNAPSQNNFPPDYTIFSFPFGQTPVETASVAGLKAYKIAKRKARAAGYGHKAPTPP